MKLGLILESPPNGTDYQVYELVVRKLRSDIEITITGCHDKKNLISECGEMAKLLLDNDDCDSVAIVWDLMPTWGGRPCRHNDKEAITASLRSAGVDLSKVKLICIEPELEGWLIADGRALTAYKTQICHPHPIKTFRDRNVQGNSNESKKIISKYLGHKYSEMTEAKKITAKITDFDRVARKHKSFKRFKDFVEGL